MTDTDVIDMRESSIGLRLRYVDLLPVRFPVIMEGLFELGLI